MRVDYKRQEAANRLEELTIIAKQMVDDIRTGDGPADPYSLLYWLRKEISHVLNELSGGRGRSEQTIKEHYERLV